MSSNSETTNADLLALIEPPGTFERQTDIIEGWVVDTETGEVISRIDVPEAFVVDSADKADWVLEIRSEIEGDLAGIRARKAALLRQLDALERRQVQRLNWWDFRFRSSLVEFARRSLVGKSKTAQFAWGKVSFRATKGTKDIVDMDAAVAWMSTWAPEKVKVKEHVIVTDVLNVRAGLAKELGEEPEYFGWLKSSGPGESVTISTGVET